MAYEDVYGYEGKGYGIFFRGHPIGIYSKSLTSCNEFKKALIQRGYKAKDVSIRKINIPSSAELVKPIG